MGVVVLVLVVCSRLLDSMLMVMLCGLRFLVRVWVSDSSVVLVVV